MWDPSGRTSRSKSTRTLGSASSSSERSGPHIDTVRRALAMWIVIALVVLYSVVIIGSFWAGQERVTTLVAALSALSSHAAAVIGFYFGQTSGQDGDRG